MMQLVYDALFWGMDLPVGGRQQPLLVVVDEAHRFLPSDGSGAAAPVFAKVAKEGRKYGVGLLIITQRPSDVDANVLSQCGTMIALRVTNPADKAAVNAAVPDDLGGLTALVPSLRTGEALILGDAMYVPSRVRIHRAADKPTGGDPALPSAWQLESLPNPGLYDETIRNWRAQSTAGATAKPQPEDTTTPDTTTPTSQ
jgi:DNA helicase HerA-like ATPase